MQRAQVEHKRLLIDAKLSVENYFSAAPARLGDSLQSSQNYNTEGLLRVYKAIQSIFVHGIRLFKPQQDVYSFV